MLFILLTQLIALTCLLISLLAPFRQQLENREAAEQNKAMMERRYVELVSQIQNLCHIDGYTNHSDIPPDAIIATVCKIN